MKCLVSRNLVHFKLFQRGPTQSVCVTVCNFIVNVWDLTYVSYYSDESLDISINQFSVITLLREKDDNTPQVR